MVEIKNAFRDKMLVTGIFFIVFSFLVFAGSDPGEEGRIRSDSFSIFLVNFGLSLLFTIILLVHTFRRYGWKWSANKTEYTFLLLTLNLVSCFSLNRELSLFFPSSPWLTACLVMMGLLLMLAGFRQAFPAWLNQVYFFLFGASLLVFLYYALYLFPHYLLGAVVFWFLGISLHVFVPVTILVFMIVYAIRALKLTPAFRLALFSGFVVPLLFCSWFAVKWISLDHTIGKVFQGNNEAGGKSLPSWIRASREISHNWISEKFLKTEISRSGGRNRGFWDFNRAKFPPDEDGKHDPLISIASLFVSQNNITRQERVKILGSVYGLRHQAQERLWSGDKLRTRHIESSIEISPEYRIAYTEKTLFIRNVAGKGRWSNQEAVYTFYLPEGSAVTSLSLWVNGTEQKGYLTTKGKADSAYRTIVGVENRDPSVVHWQEGNTVSVRVFPCTPEEDRKVKIGITTPLLRRDKDLLYENIRFDGPSASDATESIHLNFSTNPMELQTGLPMEKSSPKSHIYEGDYEPAWELRVQAPVLSAKEFSFGGDRFRTEEHRENPVSFRPEYIYLDINSSWSDEELELLWQKIENRKVFAYAEDIVQVTNHNREEVFEALQKYHFNVFPVFEISKPSHSLLISKGSAFSPDLSDLSGSPFGGKLKQYFLDGNRVKAFSFGEQVSPWLKTLKELRATDCSTGSLDLLIGYLSSDTFPDNPENENTVFIDHANLKISKTRSAAGTSGTAPDHLMRLFAYNHIMKKTGLNYFTKSYEGQGIMEEAEKAYVVTPVSSLVVLETARDYERFDIQQNPTSLFNASTLSGGSVPEPHEWALIGLALLIVLIMLKKPFG